MWTRRGCHFAAGNSWESSTVTGETADAGELARVLEPNGALYIERQRASAIDAEKLARVLENRTGLAFRWSRDLARPLAPNSPLNQLKPRSVAACARAVTSFALRITTSLGTRLARGGIALYFGTVWNTPDLRPRLNGCAGCGAVDSSDHLSATASLISLFPLLLYLCPNCGAVNVFTVDR